MSIFTTSLLITTRQYYILQYQAKNDFSFHSEGGNMKNILYLGMKLNQSYSLNIRVINYLMALINFYM